MTNEKGEVGGPATDHLMVVMSNAVPGREDEFNDWYTNEHVVDAVEKLPGFVAAQRYELSPTQFEPTQYRYLAIYRIPGDRLEEAQSSILFQRAERPVAISEGRRPLLTVSDAMDEPHLCWYFSPITDEMRSETPPAPLE
jgi:hypothetical protein